MPELLSREAVLRECRKTWRRLGVPRAELEEMANELENDLRDAEDDGIAPRSYMSDDPSGFARVWAEQRGLIRPRLCLISAAVVAVLGGIPGAGLALFFAYGLSSDTFGEMFGREVTMADGARAFEQFSPPAPLILGLYAVAGLAVAAGAFVAVRAYFGWREDSALRETSLYLLLGGIPAVGLGAGAGVGFAWYRDFQAEPMTMAGVGLLAATMFALAVAALRWLAVLNVRARGRRRFAPLEQSEVAV